MASLKIVRKHGGATTEEGKQRIENVIDSMRSTLDKYVDRIDWNSAKTEAKLKGKHVKGTFAVNGPDILIDLKLSMVAGLVKGKIENRIDQAIEEHK